MSSVLTNVTRLTKCSVCSSYPQYPRPARVPVEDLPQPEEYYKENLCYWTRSARSMADGRCKLEGRHVPGDASRRDWADPRGDQSCSGSAWWWFGTTKRALISIFVCGRSLSDMAMVKPLACDNGLTTPRCLFWMPTSLHRRPYCAGHPRGR